MSLGVFSVVGLSVGLCLRRDMPANHVGRESLDGCPALGSRRRQPIDKVLLDDQAQLSHPLRVTPATEAGLQAPPSSPRRVVSDTAVFVLIRVTPPRMVHTSVIPQLQKPAICRGVRIPHGPRNSCKMALCVVL